MSVKKIIISAIFFLLAAIISVGIFSYFKFWHNQSSQYDSRYNMSCVADSPEEIVRGQSLNGIIEEGQTVKLLRGFYDCNPIQRGDVVAYNLAGQPEPIIKIVKGLPGDTFKLEKNKQGNYNIIINNQVAKTSFGQAYELPEGRQKMLELYTNDYQGVIPPNAYLILGNQPEGTLDSTRFGLVGKEGIIGKIEIRSKN